MTRRVIDSLLAHARCRPDESAIVEIDGTGKGRSITWARLARAVAGASRHLSNISGPHAVVIVSSPNQVELVVAVFGGLAAARVFPVPLDLTATELRAAARESGATALIGPSSANEMLGNTSVEWSPLDGLLQLESPAIGSYDGRGELLLQSSGTTGLPQIARREMAALDAVAGNCVAALSLGPSDRMLVALPLTHSFGLEHGILSCILAGATLELHKRFEPDWAMDALASGGVTHMPGVPFMFDIMAQRNPPRCTTNIRHVYSAGSPLPVAVAEAFHAAVGIPLGQIYGATEFGSVTFNNPYRPGYDPGTAGVPMAGVRLRIFDRENPDPNAPLPIGQEGELAVAAPSMLSAYVGHASPPTRDGWFLTGDLARLDDAGRLTITGRLKLMIDTGGMKVNPFEVESVLTLHPGVREAVVLPMPITPTLNRLRAVVQLRSGAAVTADDLRRFARERLSSHKVPREFDLRSSLPRTPMGKVLRKALQCV